MKVGKNKKNSLLVNRNDKILMPNISKKENQSQKGDDRNKHTRIIKLTAESKVWLSYAGAENDSADTGK